jgi:gluconate 2-dehydrogenase gamma chain
MEGERAKHMTDEQVQERLSDRRVSRRRLLISGATSGAAVSGVLASAAAFAQQPTTQVAPAQQPTAQTTRAQPGFTYFNSYQAAVIIAACARIIPTDDNGPGATEAGVVYFIDRQLSSDYGFSGRRYEHGPYAPGSPTQGDQSGTLMRDRYRLGILGMDGYARQVYQTGFAQLSPDQQDRVLTDMQNSNPQVFDGASAFFNVLRAHTIAGFFADPVHGGNRDMVGWKLIGFPGAQMSSSAAISRYGQPWQGGYKTLAEYQGQYLAS